MSDPYEGQKDLLAFGTQGAIVTADDLTDLAPIAKAVVVTSVAGGNVLEVLPADNDPDTDDWITFTGVTVGFMPPYRVSRVGEATDCAVASVDW